MGGVWEGLGRLLGTLGPSLAVFLEFRNSAAAGSSELLGQDGLKEAFWIDFGVIERCGVQNFLRRQISELQHASFSFNVDLNLDYICEMSRNEQRTKVLCFPYTGERQNER